MAVHGLDEGMDGDRGMFELLPLLRRPLGNPAVGDALVVQKGGRKRPHQR